MNEQIYSMEYERDGYKFSMRVLADKNEAEFIADSLGLGSPELVVAIIPSLQRGLN